MIEAALLALLRCPESKQPLTLASPDIIARLDKRRAAGSLRNHEGKPVIKAIGAGLVREDGARFYVIDAGIPILISGEGIDLSGR